MKNYSNINFIFRWMFYNVVCLYTSHNTKRKNRWIFIGFSDSFIIERDKVLNLYWIYWYWQKNINLNFVYLFYTHMYRIGSLWKTLPRDDLKTNIPKSRLHNSVEGFYGKNTYLLFSYICCRDFNFYRHFSISMA